MKLTAMFLVIASLTASAEGLSQITISKKDAPLQEVFKEIQKQSGYEFFYSYEVVQKAGTTTVIVKDVTLQKAIEATLQGKKLSYQIIGKTVVIKEVEQSKREIYLPPFITIDVQGVVVDDKGEPVIATVKVKGTTTAVTTNEKGFFSLKNVADDAVLVISAVNIDRLEVRVSGRADLGLVHVNLKTAEMDEVTVNKGYYTTSKKLNTGNVDKVTAGEIEHQPITNPLAALQGRIPGLVITQSSGVPGSSFKVELRGQTVLDQSISRNDPLFVINGVPFEAGNLPSNQLTSAANNPVSISQGGISPLNTISPSDIESIEVLKDADATAIYGSRGANGVILITTKKGKAGKTLMGLSYYRGWSRANYRMDMLNTQQYIKMRREGFQNDAEPITTTNAPDLLIWDTTRYTDFKKLLIGNTASTSQYQVSLSGGTSQTQFLINGTYHRETNVFSSDLADQIASAYLQINHQTADKKFDVQISTSYSADKNNLIQTDLSRYINLPPNLKLHDNDGNLAWSENGVMYSNVNYSFENPLAELLKKYTSENDNFIANVSFSYQIFKNIKIKTSAGFNQFLTDEVSINPSKSIDPNTSTLPNSSFAFSRQKSWIVEPQVQWDKAINKSKFSVLIGGTFQKRQVNREVVNGTNYANDLLLNSMAAAGSLSATNSGSDYHYAAAFARLHYSFKNTYIVNLTGRRDGSSRFSPENRFANFGSIGTAWLVSNEKWFKIPLISFAKLRGSYGTTGNDQIGDYKFLNLWGTTSQPYGGIPGLTLRSLYNPKYNWEKTKKLEAALELNLYKDRIQLSFAYYRHRSSNQLVNYTLPSQTGFFNVIQNLPAVVQNSGFEGTIGANIFNAKRWKWSTSANITIPRNKLISFPNLASSAYYSVYVEGQSLNVIRALHFLGVDPATGLYDFRDVNKDGFWSDEDYLVSGSLDPKFYGGIQNTITYKNLSLAFLLQFKKQTGTNYLRQVTDISPGTIYNQPSLVLDRWQNVGDRTGFQQFTTLAYGPVDTRLAYLGISDGVYSDASFVRLKTASLSYELPEKWLRSVHFTRARINLDGQNLFTLTKYKGTDPESQNFYVLPPLRTIVLGVQLNF